MRLQKTRREQSADCHNASPTKDVKDYQDHNYRDLYTENTRKRRPAAGEIWLVSVVGLGRRLFGFVGSMRATLVVEE